MCANFDGASVNLGQKGGVIAKIRDVIPDVMGLHCVAHKLELAAHDATKSYNISWADGKYNQGNI